jgi:hypothetical protein
MMSFIETNTIVHLEQDNRSFGGLIDSLLAEDEVFDWAVIFTLMPVTSTMASRPPPQERHLTNSSRPATQAG